MNYILVILFVLIAVYQYTNWYKKRRSHKLREELESNWGKQKIEDYFPFHLIEKYFDSRDKEGSYCIISDKVKSDLDINEVFKFIDRTKSKVGQQYLYNKLRSIESKGNLIKFDTLVNTFYDNKTLSIDCQVQLTNLDNDDSYYLEELLSEDLIDKPKFLWVVYLLSILVASSIALSFFFPVVLLMLLPLLLINTFIHYKNKKLVNYYLRGVKQLTTSIGVANEISLFPILKLQIPDVGFLINLNIIKNKTRSIAFENKVRTEFEEFAWIVMELFKIIFNVEYLAFHNLIRVIKIERKSIDKLFKYIGKIDTAISVASLKHEEKGKICIPQFIDKKEIYTEGITHPLLTNCVANKVNLKDNSMIITGSNMSGKTTFIRTVAVNSILSQTINLCFASEYKAPFFKIFSSIRITDDLLEDTSYYLEEVTTIKELIDLSSNSDPCLLVLDEIFKGTNTVERISGGKAILSYLNTNNNIVIVSTHDIELTELLKDEGFELYHFSEDVKDNELHFDYKLKEGKLKTRNAIKILELYGYPPEVIKDSRKTEKLFNVIPNQNAL